MKITTEQELQPFSVPNYVLAVSKARPRQEGPNFDAPKYHLSELSDDVLLALCEQFKQYVLEKARENRDSARGDKD